MSARTLVLIAALGPITMSNSLGFMQVVRPEIRSSIDLCAGIECRAIEHGADQRASAGPMNWTRGLPPSVRRHIDHRADHRHQELAELRHQSRHISCLQRLPGVIASSTA